MRAKRQKAVDLIGKAVFVGADMVKAEAQRSITEGSVSGRFHVASKPGEPPNADTRQLDKSIAAKKTGPVSAEVRATAPYAAAQEFGYPPSNLAERPYMRPAATKTKPKIVALIKRAKEKAFQ